MTEALKSCPFCGGRPDVDAPRGALNRDRTVYCTDCGATIGADNPEELLAMWNRRASGVPAGEQTQHHLGNPAAPSGEVPYRAAPRSEPCAIGGGELPARPEFDRDDDGELLIDWSPSAGRMLTLSLRADGRLSYALTWDGEKQHGTAAMPAAAEHRCTRWADGKCLECGRSWGAPR